MYKQLRAHGSPLSMQNVHPNVKLSASFLIAHTPNRDIKLQLASEEMKERVYLDLHSEYGDEL